MSLYRSKNKQNNMRKIRLVDAQDNHKNIYSYKHLATFKATKLGVTVDVVHFFLTNLGHENYIHIGG